ncbi:MAG: hypothetical protein GY763_10895, partial [Gammaproteobacteria bacterium]|nr:hypothetical protein [Gammaproteobacteria bacterium]
VDEFKKKRMFKNAAPSEDASSDAGSTTQQPEIEAKGTEGYGNIFAPANLEDQVDSDKAD